MQAMASLIWPARCLMLAIVVQGGPIPPMNREILHNSYCDTWIRRYTGAGPLPTTCCDIVRMKDSSGTSVLHLLAYDSNRSFVVAHCDPRDGWMTILRRFNGSLTFDRSFYEYESGFGSLEGEFWYGLKHLHSMTQMGGWALKVDLYQSENCIVSTIYGSFKVGNASTGYKLELKEPQINGFGTRNLLLFNGAIFSTQDRGNTRCARQNEGGWWYVDSCYGAAGVVLTARYNSLATSWSVDNHMDPVSFPHYELKMRPDKCEPFASLQAARPSFANLSSKACY